MMHTLNIIRLVIEKKLWHSIPHSSPYTEIETDQDIYIYIKLAVVYYTHTRQRSPGLIISNAW